MNKRNQKNRLFILVASILIISCIMITTTVEKADAAHTNNMKTVAAWIQANGKVNNGGKRYIEGTFTNVSTQYKLESMIKDTGDGKWYFWSAVYYGSTMKCLMTYYYNVNTDSVYDQSMTVFNTSTLFVKIKNFNLDFIDSYTPDTNISYTLSNTNAYTTIPSNLQALVNTYFKLGVLSFASLGQNNYFTLNDIGYYSYWTDDDDDSSDFEIEDNVLVKYKGAKSEVTIPNGITTIGEEAFAKNTAITSVIIPKGVTTIEYKAFAQCYNLEKVTLPETLKAIGVGAFESCNIKNIIIPSGVETIPKYAFRCCYKLASITIPESIIYIASDAFYENNALKDVYYAGSSKDWKSITKLDGNDDLSNASLHCTKIFSGWYILDGKWLYNDTEGNSSVGWTCISQKWYYFDDNGYMVSNKWLDSYYLGSDGAMLTDTWIGNYYVDSTGKWRPEYKTKPTWIKDSNGKYWYKHYDGSYTTNAFEKINKKWYYFDNNGYMVTGWKFVSGKYYYFSSDGDMVTGWKQISGKWYFFTNDGDMAIGWKLISGVYYYFSTDGDMATGWKQISGKWYFFANDGEMKTGWLSYGGKWYYFNNSGEMNTSYIIDGKRKYEFNADGTCKNPNGKLVLPDGAIQYNGHGYLIVSETIAWTEAKEAAEKLGGHLVTITSAGEQSFIENTLNTKNMRLWIGAYRDTDDVWKWVTGEKWSYSNWLSGEPSGTGQSAYSEKYGAVWPKTWNDMRDGNLYEQRGYIVEFE